MLAEFESHGHTYTQHAAGTFVVITREPENIQALLGTKFRDFNLGADRRGNFAALVGQGVFTQEGEEWAKSRALLR
jgi:cytochrome P450